MSNGGGYLFGAGKMPWSATATQPDQTFSLKIATEAGGG